MPRRALSIILAAAGLSACASGYEEGPGRAWAVDGVPAPAYRGGQWVEPRRPYAGELTGPGLAILDDWLKETPEGRAIVTLGFGDAGGGVVSEDVAHRVNIWFRRYADHDRDMTITDPEIRTALVTAAGGHLRPPRQPSR